MWLLQSPVNPKHVAPSHGPPARVLSPVSLWLQSLSCCLSRVAKRSTPKPRGPLPFPSEPHGPLFTSPKLPDPGPLSFPSEPRGILLFYFRTTWTFIYLLASEPRGSPSYFGAAWSTPSFRAAWSPPFSPKTLWSSPFYGCRA